MLDFPLPTGQAVAAGETKSRYPGGVFDPGKFVKQVLSLMLEGASRNGKESVRAPLSPRAKEIADRVMADRYPDLRTLQADLKENLTHPPEVGTGMRAGHLTVQAMLLGLGLFVMLLVGESLSLVRASIAVMEVERSERYEEWIDTPEKRERLTSVLKQIDSPGGGERGWMRYLSTPAHRQRAAERLREENVTETIESLRRLTAIEYDLVAQSEQYLNSPEVAMLRLFKEQTDTRMDARPVSDEIKATELTARLALARPELMEQRKILRSEMNGIAAFFLFLLLVWPLLIWPLFAVAFRGGLSYWFAGLTLVRTDGRKVGRFRCGVRELVVWLPFTACLLVSLIIQYQWPELVTVRTFFWLLGVLALPLMVAAALRKPAQGPHDRLLETHIVPV